MKVKKAHVRTMLPVASAGFASFWAWFYLVLLSPYPASHAGDLSLALKLAFLVGVLAVLLLVYLKRDLFGRTEHDPLPWAAALLSLPLGLLNLAAHYLAVPPAAFFAAWFLGGCGFSLVFLLWPKVFMVGWQKDVGAYLSASALAGAVIYLFACELRPPYGDVALVLLPLASLAVLHYVRTHIVGSEQEPEAPLEQTRLFPLTGFTVAVFGALFGIIIVKMLFGGLGKNFMNPALGARAFMLASWAGLMTTWTQPHASLPLIGSVTVTDAISTATPLAALKTGALPDASLLELFLGETGGVIGETSALALIAGGAYLLWRKVITINIPAAYILTVAVITFLFPLSGDVSRVQWMLSQVLSGGLMLGAIFMATDYVTSPVTPRGQIIFGIDCGLLTVFIRYFGGLPEGVSYSILIMNTLVWAIDKKTHPRKFGYQLDKAKKEAQ